MVQVGTGTGEPAGHERANHVTAILVRWEPGVPGSRLGLSVRQQPLHRGVGIGPLPPTRDPRGTDGLGQPARLPGVEEVGNCAQRNNREGSRVRRVRTATGWFPV